MQKQHTHTRAPVCERPRERPIAAPVQRQRRGRLHLSAADPVNELLHRGSIEWRQHACAAHVVVLLQMPDESARCFCVLSATFPRLGNATQRFSKTI
jgi:hypothetical protein